MVLYVGSVCSGIEAASVAWNPLGFHFEWFSETAGFPSRVLSARYPDVPNLGDMNDIPALLVSGQIDAPDIICGGTPCQAFSFAGRQKGLRDVRGNLTLRFADIIDTNDAVRRRCAKKQTLVLWENVEGVLSDKTNAFGCFISLLAGLSDIMPMHRTWPTAGFLRGPERTVAWRVLDAKFFGVPQQRRRLYVVAGAEDIHPERILFEECTATDSEKRCPEYGCPEPFRVDGHDFEVFRAYTDCLFSSYATKWNGNASANNGSLFVVQDGRIRRFSPLECERLMGFPDGYTGIDGATKSARYQALGNSWAVPVIVWIGENILQAYACMRTSSLFPIRSGHGTEYLDCSKSPVVLPDGGTVNTSCRPEKTRLGDMRTIVSPDDVPDIYLSPVGCAGIIRRSEERKTAINARLLHVLRECADTMPKEAIEKRSRIQRRGKQGTAGKKS